MTAKSCQGGQSLGRACFRELAGFAAEGVRFPLLSAADPGDAGYAQFASRFAAERGGTPDGQVVLTYDATCLLIEAIRQAGPNRARIRAKLTQLSPWPGLAGLIQFDGTGQNSRTNVGLGTVRNGVSVAFNPPRRPSTSCGSAGHPQSVVVSTTPMPASR